MKIIGKPAETTETTLGPQKWNGTVSDSTNGCVEVLSTGIGRIKEIINTGTLIQPQKYKYYMGYNASNAETANNSAFQKFVLTQEKFYPVTGDAHAMYKLADGVLKDINSDSGLNFTPQTILAIAAGLPLFSGIFFGAVAKALGWYIVLNTASVGGGCVAAGIQYVSAHSLLSAAAVSAIGIALVVVALAILVIALFLWSTDKTYEESGCPNFLHHYTTTPYIETSSALSRTVDLLTNNNGYYSDGVYHYQQSGGVITSKTPSNITGLTSEDPLKLTKVIALQVDNPTRVETINKLLVLPYTSGKPVPFCGEGNPIYYSEERTETLNITDCAELVSTPGTKTITLDTSSSFSCVSVSDANSKTLSQWNKLKGFATGSIYKYSSGFSGSSLGTLEGY